MDVKSFEHYRSENSKLKRHIETLNKRNKQLEADQKAMFINYNIKVPDKIEIILKKNEYLMKRVWELEYLLKFFYDKIGKKNEKN